MSCKILLISSIIEIVCGAFLISIFHPVFSASSTFTRSSLALDINKGLSANITASPKAGSKKILATPISSGSVLFINSIASCSGFRKDSSIRITILFFMVLTILETTWAFFSKYPGFLEYRAIRGPSYSIFVSSASLGRFWRIAAIILWLANSWWGCLRCI